VVKKDSPQRSAKYTQRNSKEKFRSFVFVLYSLFFRPCGMSQAPFATYVFILLSDPLHIGITPLFRTEAGKRGMKNTPIYGFGTYKYFAV
jgi:hypothetical protein